MSIRKGLTRWAGIVAGLAAALWVAAGSPGMAQSSMRLYVLDCGNLPLRNPAAAGLPGGPIDHPTPCFLIVHPKGVLLWENGLNDATWHHQSGDPTKEIVTRSLQDELVAIGYPPSKITYLAFSHYHHDHAGNSNDFAGSTWLAQKDMRAAMFGPWPGVTKAPERNASEWSALKNAKTILIDNKDYDVFGDGSVELLYTPAVTPGHQSLFVKLPKTGPVVIAGDLYTQPEARKLYRQLAGLPIDGAPYGKAELEAFQAKTNAQSLKSMAKIEAFLANTHAQLWIQHDVHGYQALKKAPAYYE